MIVSDELVEGAEQPTFPEEDEAVETLLRIERTKSSA